MDRFKIKSKADVETHSDGHRPSRPAINVKCHDFPDSGKLAERLGCAYGEAQHAARLAFDSAQERFWEDAVELGREVFGDSVKIYSEGRMSGWVAVHGLPDIADWDATELACWRRFARLIGQTYAYAIDFDAVCEAIQSNEWADLDAEQYNYVERKDGTSVTVPQIKRAERAARAALLAVPA